MSSKLLEQIAEGGAFDVAEAIRELARVLTEGPIKVEGTITAGSGIHGLAKDRVDVPDTTEAGGALVDAVKGKRK